VLVQAGLLYHHTTSEGRTFYEANPRNAYYLIRSGRFIDIVDKRYGKAAAVVVVQLLLLGFASIGQLKKSSQKHDGSARTTADAPQSDGAKSTSFQHVPAHTCFELELDNALKTLINQGLVCRLRHAYLQTEADNRQIAEGKVYSIQALSAVKGTKAKEEIAAKIEEIMDKQAGAHIDLVNFNSKTALSQKRKISPLDESPPRSKRLKATNGVAAQEADSDLASLVDDETNLFNDNLVVRLNHSRLLVFFRNSRLLRLAASTYGKSVSRTYEAVLKQLEPDQPDPPADSSLAPQNENFRDTSKEVDEGRLAQDLSHHRTDDGRPESQWKSVNGCVDSVKHQLAPEVRSHLDILCEQPFRFLSHSQEHPDKYVVEYSDLCVQLRNSEIFQIISARFDKYALRIVRVLLDRGKVDEKSLQEIVLMSAKELRQTLAILHQAGFLELQEVPRESQRQPSRTMYLWFYDPDRARKMLTEDTYKGISRCMQRMKVERDKVKTTIEKSERSDVRDREEQLLAKAELGVLREWRRKEEWLLGEIGRLDELILVLRDI
jgi:DNA-directed RNA polymerase III subunit RPC3